MADARAWRHAAMLGSLWAAVEIVAGSLLHSLRVPFSGSILGAFGVIVMVAGYRTTPHRGVIWRSALVCALMKSLSPSAVLLGPMVGILAEGLLLQASITVLGANPAGFVIGGALAVSWALAQKILWALAAFGPDAVRLYAEAYRFASQSLGVTRFGPLDLVGTLFVFQGTMGAVAAVAGLRIGMKPAPFFVATVGEATTPRSAVMPAEAHGDWSLPRLAALGAGTVGGMLVIGLSSLPIAALYSFVYACAVIGMYSKAMGRLLRPAFWLESVGLMLLTALLFGGVRTGMPGALEGLGMGARMVLRATLLLLGLRAVSVELRNPRILGWLERRGLQGLSNAMAVAVDSLPTFIAAVSDRRRFWRHPLLTIAGMLQAAKVFSHPQAKHHQGVVILTGETGIGKTTCAREVVRLLRQRGLTVGGVLAPGLLEGTRRSGFDLTDLATGHTVPLCRVWHDAAKIGRQRGPFHFDEFGLEFGRRAIARSLGSADVAVIDEVGPLELAGGGWATSIDQLVRTHSGPILLVARTALADAVGARWAVKGAPVCHAACVTPTRVADLLSERLMGVNRQLAFGK